MRVIQDLNVARQTVLRRRAAAAVELPEAIRATNRAVFGEDLDAGAAVQRIVAAVRAEGDAAIRRFTRAFDRSEVGALEVTAVDLDRSWEAQSEPMRQALTLAAERIRRFHERSLPRSWYEFDGDSTFGQVFRPIRRVGVYAPGGRAAYPSTVLMTIVPARVAGVSEIILCTPPGREGLPDATILAAAKAAGVDRVFRVGGAQAIAALAFGTDSIPLVDKVVGPGNLFVALAKQQVFGTVGIDQLAGPTETMLIADSSASPSACAADLLAQAEHDPLASALLLTPEIGLAEAVAREVERQIAGLPRRAIIAESLERHGGIVVTPDLLTAFDLANEYAPEHLCLLVRDAHNHLPRVRNAGGIFLGERSIEAIGDYTAGPSHVMPTGGTARFASPLNVLDFLKVSNVFDVGPGVFAEIGPAAITLAEAEGLAGHAAAIRLRQGPEARGE
ncbi:MAG TPA: histidinol dehydrogenase [Chloroflexota bacterium]|nr:histidinol dehydrogenase [Chloroflexota bacterium]